MFAIQAAAQQYNAIQNNTKTNKYNILKGVPSLFSFPQYALHSIHASLGTHTIHKFC